jgi:hypothetical protein
MPQSVPELLTVGELARLTGHPLWRIREVVDGLGVTILRAGQYRLVPRSLVPDIRRKLSEKKVAAPA